MLATIDTIHPLHEALSLMIVGMGVVFVALVLLMMTVGVLNRLSVGVLRSSTLSTSSASSVASVASASSASSVALGSQDAGDPQLIAVLSAAAATALQRPVRVTHVEHTGVGGGA